MSLRLGMAVDATETVRLLEIELAEGRDLASALAVIKARRKMLSTTGDRACLKATVEYVLREVYAVLLDVDDGDDLDLDVMPQLRTVVKEAMGYQPHKEA